MCCGWKIGHAVEMDQACQVLEGLAMSRFSQKTIEVIINGQVYTIFFITKTRF